MGRLLEVEGNIGLIDWVTTPGPLIWCEHHMQLAESDEAEQSESLRCKGSKKRAKAGTSDIQRARRLTRKVQAKQYPEAASPDGNPQLPQSPTTSSPDSIPALVATYVETCTIGRLDFEM